MRILALYVFLALATCIAYSGSAYEGSREIQIDERSVYNFTITLMELREDSQKMKPSEEQLNIIIPILRAAVFEKKAEYVDVAGAPYISRYLFTFGYRGGTQHSGKTESGIITIDAKTVYWNDMIFSISDSYAEQLLEVLPKPINPATKSEKADYKQND
ncbi:MAG: hypothetical protein KJZ78_21680 [Bryobacteraceae bacterium]|nr:hypothetical protein [Bryobacteraceae bacterium]